MPPSIIVSIVNVDRNRDFLPSHNESMPTSGGAKDFLEFFKTELMPYVNINYPTKGEDILLGHSFGGVFAMYALLEEPQLFEAYLPGDPSFWWDDGVMVDMAAKRLPELEGKGKILFITGRSDNSAYAGMGIDKMDSVLNLFKPDDLYWKSVAYPNESHGTSRLKSAYDGLRYAYEGFGSVRVEFHPMNGIFKKGEPVKIWNTANNSNIRYTTDGSTPTLESSEMKGEFLLTEPGVLKAKAFSPRGNFDSDVLEGKFLEGVVIKPVQKLKQAQSGGFNYAFYKGQWQQLPDFGTMKHDLKGIMDENFNLDSLPLQEDFACLIEGYIKIESDGYYIFGLDSDDGSRLYLGDQLLVDQDGLHATGNMKSYVLPLKKGFYPLRLEYFQGKGGRAINLVYVIPGADKPSPIPPELKYYLD